MLDVLHTAWTVVGVLIVVLCVLILGLMAAAVILDTFSEDERR